MGRFNLWGSWWLAELHLAEAQLRCSLQVSAFRMVGRMVDNLSHDKWQLLDCPHFCQYTFCLISVPTVVTSRCLEGLLWIPRSALKSRITCWLAKFHWNLLRRFVLRHNCYLTEKRSLHTQSALKGWVGRSDKCPNTDKQADNADGPDNHKQNTSWLISWEAQSVWGSTGMLSLPLKF